MNAPVTLDSHNQHIAAAYDNRPYVSKAFWYSSPGHLRAAAHLYGVDTVPLERARVLELGCAAGGNLLPFALAYPNATVVGVDLSPVQIEHGRHIIEKLGVENLQLHALDLSKITREFGEFDYIIAHGVFSWVPPEVKQALLRLCRENLSPKGLAYVSYNAYPGWKAGDVVRDAMTLHGFGAETDEERIGSARAVLGFLSEGMAASNGMGVALQNVVRVLREQSDFYIEHEYLERFNTPCYLVEFADAAEQAGLTYLGDADPHTEVPAAYGPNVQLRLGLIAMGKPKALRQQYLDFATGRNFRKSLLVHKERAAEILALPDPEKLKDLRYAGRFVELPTTPQSDARRVVRNQRGNSIVLESSTMESVTTAMTAAWPRCVTYEELVAEVSKTPSQLTPEDEVLACLNALFCKGGIVHMSMGEGPYDRDSPDVPTLIPGFAYLHGMHAEAGFSLGVFNLWHNAIGVSLDGAQAWLLRHIDGKSDHKQLLAKLIRAWQQGVVPGSDGQSLAGQRNLDAAAQKCLNSLIRVLRETAVLR
ncbi:hypothetical protein D9M72_231520 [compost metagenome]